MAESLEKITLGQEGEIVSFVNSFVEAARSDPGSRSDDGVEKLVAMLYAQEKRDRSLFKAILDELQNDVTTRPGPAGERMRKALSRFQDETIPGSVPKKLAA